MTPNIHKNNVYSYREPMWHKMGTVGQEQETAMQIYARMEPVEFTQQEYSITLNDKVQGSGEFAIIRSDNGHETKIGTTKDRYRLVQPIEYCQAWDESTGVHVETLGFLGHHGEKLFITSKLPTIDIFGDPIELYHMMTAGFDGKYGIHQNVVQVRTVCSNTHAMAMADAENTNNHGRGELYSGKHNQANHMRDLKAWLSYVQRDAEQTVQMTQNLFCKMESTKVSTDKAHSLVEQIFPNAKQLPDFYPTDLRMEKQKEIEEKNLKAQENRDLVMSLFGGAGIAITPTAYGLFNAVTEAENHHKPSKKDGTYSILLGGKHAIMENALSVIGDFAQNS